MEELLYFSISLRRRELLAEREREREKLGRPEKLRMSHIVDEGHHRGKSCGP